MTQYTQWLDGHPDLRPRRLGRDAAAGHAAALGPGRRTRRSSSSSRRSSRSRCRSRSACWTAMKRDKPVDHVTSTVTLVLAALPEFVIGMRLILVFATGLFHWFPAVSLLAPGEKAWEDPQVVVLPAATLIIAVVPVHQPHHARLDDRGARERVRDDGAAQGTAGAAGDLAPCRAERDRPRHPGRPRSQLAWMAGGIVIVEFVFQYPGIGAALVDAVAQPRHAGRPERDDARGRALRRSSTSRRTSRRSSSPRG